VIRPAYIAVLVAAAALGVGASWYYGAWWSRPQPSGIDTASLKLEIKSYLNQHLSSDKVTSILCARSDWKLDCLAARTEQGHVIPITAVCESGGGCVWGATGPIFDFVESASDAAAVTAEADIRSIIPAIESYYADNGTYSGVTLTGLQTTYDQSLDPSLYLLRATRGGQSYCVQSPAPGTTPTWRKAGPAASIEPGAC
jgi:hypothetical protein